MFNILLFLSLPVTCISCKQAEHVGAEEPDRPKRKRTPTEKAAEGEKNKKRKNRTEKAKAAGAKPVSVAVVSIPILTPEERQMIQDLEESEANEPPPEVGYFLLTSKVIFVTVFFSREDEGVSKTPFFYMSNGKNQALGHSLVFA